MTSDQIMESLLPYGRTSVYQSSSDGAFSAKTNLFVQGMTAEVHSGFGHPTMLAALTALQTKVFALVRPAAADLATRTEHARKANVQLPAGLTSGSLREYLDGRQNPEDA